MAVVIISGVVQGIFYALISLGLVLIYRQSRILNFAHGGIATLAAYVAFGMLNVGAPYWVAAVAAIIAGAACSVAVEMLVVRPLSGGSPLAAKVGTIGAGLMIIGGITLVFGSTQVSLPPALGSRFDISFGDFTLGGNQALAVIVTLGLTALLLFVLRYTRIGVALRAVSEGPLTARMMGVNVEAVRSVTWGIAGGLSAVAALLLIPEQYLDPNFITDFMIAAFVAVVLGGFESIIGTLIGGIVFGVVSALFSFYFTERLTNTLAFVSIVLTLVFLPHGLFGQSLKRVVEPVIPGHSIWRLGVARLQGSLAARLAISTSPALRRSLVAAALLGSLVVPYVIAPPYVYTIGMVAAVSVAALSQNLVCGYSGQLSIGQSGFMVVGAYVTVVLQTALGWSFFPSLLASMIAAGLSGFCFGFPAIRLSGVYLAMLTMTFALAMPEFAAFPGDLTGAGMGIHVPPPTLFGWSLAGSQGVYYFTIVVFWIVVLGVHLLTSSPVGRFWIAVRDSEIAAASIGIDVARRKIEVFGLGAALAGLGGAMAACLVGHLSPDNYTLWMGVFLLLAIIVGGVASTLGSILGAAFIVVMPVVLAGLPDIPQLAYGVVVLAFLFVAPEGIASLVAPGAARRDGEKPTGARQQGAWRASGMPSPAEEAQS